MGHCGIYYTVKKKTTKCDHYWSYLNQIWAAGNYSAQDSVAIGRYCFKCGRMQTSVARSWHPLPKSYVDMRETLQKELKS